jgi:hypothetical protein
MESWKSRSYRNVHWLNEPGQRELAMTQVVYGNDMWSRVVLFSCGYLYQVPAFGKRKT